jgi:DKNYY family
MRRAIAALCLVAVALVPACSRNKPPNALFDGAGYHVRADNVYFLGGFPGRASEISGANAASFEAFDTTYARDKSRVYFDGRPLPDADAASFELRDRPGFFKDRQHVYQLDRPISDDPAHFELLDGDLAKDGASVYWSDGSVRSDDLAHFVIVSNQDHYLFTKDSRTVHANGNPIDGADPATFRVLQGAYVQDGQRVYYFTDPIDGADPNTFRVLNADFECSADQQHAYYRQTVIANADPRSFPPDRAVTRCDETSITFAD